MADPTKIMAIVASLIIAAASFGYCLTKQRRYTKKPLYLMAGVLSLYFAVLYIIASTDAGMQSQLVRSGILTRYGQVVLFAIIGLLIVSDWQQSRE